MAETNPIIKQSHSHKSNRTDVRCGPTSMATDTNPTIINQSNSQQSNRTNVRCGPTSLATDTNPTTINQSNSQQSNRADVRCATTSMTTDPSKIIINLVNSANKCKRTVATKFDVNINQLKPPPPQIDQPQSSIPNNFSRCSRWSQSSSMPTSTGNVMNHSRVLSTPFEPPQIQNVNLSKVDSRGSVNGLTGAPLPTKHHQKSSTNCFVSPSTSTTELLHGNNASAIERYTHIHALKLFNSPCLRFLNNYCTRSGCVYAHILPDPADVLLKLSGFPSDLLTRVYDTFVLNHFKIFVTYFPTFTIVFGRLKIRDKLIAMIGDCESPQRNCVHFFENIFTALSECNLTANDALRMLMQNRRSTNHQTTNVLVDLILKTNVLDFLDVLQQFTSDEHYTFENGAIANLMRVSLQLPQRFDLMRTLMLILQRKTAAQFWEYDPNLYMQFLAMVGSSNLTNFA